MRLREPLLVCAFLGALAVTILCAAGKTVDAKGGHKLQGTFEASNKGRDRGNETTGQAAAWLLGAANLTVALSVLIKGFDRYCSPSDTIKSGLTRFNRSQKKLLMPLHFFLNPIILAIALTHWALSHCRSTALPEWGLALMATLVLLGLALKFRLCPKELMKAIYRIHAHPLPLILLVLLLLIGHVIMD